MKIEQGDLLKVQGLSCPVMVVSNTYFNQTGKCIVCPILKNAEEGPVHIRVQSKKIEGVVLCEQVRFIDLTKRSFSKIDSSSFFTVMDISDAVMGIFDYQMD